MIPRGKGLFIWQVWKLEKGLIDKPKYDAIVQRLVDSKTDFVSIKFADDEYPYNVRWGKYPYWSGGIQADFLAVLVPMIKTAGIRVFGWQYVRGSRPLEQADAAADRILALGMDGLDIDAEAEYKVLGNRDEAARTYTNRLGQRLDGLPISLCSYRYPKLHAQLPFIPFLRGCQYIAQQCYWEGAHNPPTQLDSSIAQYKELVAGAGLAQLPFVPVGSAYKVGSWRCTPEDIQAFYDHALKLGLPGASLWSMDYMRMNMPELWEVYAAIEWPRVDPPAPPDPPPADQPVVTVRHRAGQVEIVVEELP